MDGYLYIYYRVMIDVSSVFTHSIYDGLLCYITFHLKNIIQISSNIDMPLSLVKTNRTNSLQTPLHRQFPAPEFIHSFNYIIPPEWSFIPFYLIQRCHNWLWRYYFILSEATRKQAPRKLSRRIAPRLPLTSHLPRHRNHSHTRTPETKIKT